MFVLSLLNAHREGLMVERRTRERLEALQRKKFRTLVKHCLENSPYYRAIIADRGINPDRCEVEDFPVLDKATVIANFDRIATHPAVTWARVSRFAAEGGDDETLMDGRFHVIHTSGSSGRDRVFRLLERRMGARPRAGAPHQPVSRPAPEARLLRHRQRPRRRRRHGDDQQPGPPAPRL